MKKLILFLGIFISLSACSSDDNNDELPVISSSSIVGKWAFSKSYIRVEYKDGTTETYDYNWTYDPFVKNNNITFKTDGTYCEYIDFDKAEECEDKYKVTGDKLEIYFKEIGHWDNDNYTFEVQSNSLILKMDLVKEAQGNDIEGPGVDYGHPSYKDPNLKSKTLYLVNTKM